MFRLGTALLAMALLLAACGGSSGSSSSSSSAPPASSSSSGGTENASAEGKQVFTQNCGGCHTLKDAGTTGSVGPDLDQLKPSFDVVEHQVENGGGVMPAFEGTLSDSDIANVSAYVSSVAGQ